MLWCKALHIITLVAWFAGLFYLPRLFVYHSEISPQDSDNYQRFCIMERRLYWGIMTPNAILALLFGYGLVKMMHFSLSPPPLWLSLKLMLVALVVVYHLLCARFMWAFKQLHNTHTALFYRIFNEIAIVLFSAIVFLVVLKPH